MIQTYVIVDAVAVWLVRADEPVVNKQLVVGMSTIGGKNFFAGI